MMPSKGRIDPFSRYELAKVALGESDADIAIVNSKIVNVYTAEITSGDTVLVKGDRIAFTGKYSKRGIGVQTRVIDAKGMVLVPGFIDGHTHMDYLYSSRELARYALKSGTTSIITEAAEIAFRLGYQGIIEYLKSTRRQPVKFWFTVPPMGTVSPIAARHILTSSEISRLLRRSDCVGLGEVYWGPANAGRRQELDFITAALKAGKKIEGHSAGAAAGKLQAYIALGITSDHEPITAEETLERLRLGLSVMIREGEVRQELEAVSKIKDFDLDFRRLSVSTDGIGPWQLTNLGFMDHLVQKAIDLGFPPVRAIQMGTLNVAEHFNLQDFIGGIAPGRFADLVLVPEIDVIKPQLVISNGQVGWEEGKTAIIPRRHIYPSSFYNCVRLERELTPADFRVVSRSAGDKTRVHVIDQLTKVLTRESIVELPVSGGEVRMDISRDTIKVAAVEYMHAPGTIFTGFIRGLGLRQGAVATSTCWDAAVITAAGADEGDIALAINRIRELGGGTVVSAGRKVLAEAAFPVASLISEKPVEDLAQELTSVQKAAEVLGCTSNDIRTTLSVLTTPAIPYLRICESGLFSIRSNSIMELETD